MPLGDDGDDTHNEIVLNTSSRANNLGARSSARDPCNSGAHPASKRMEVDES